MPSQVVSIARKLVTENEGATVLIHHDRSAASRLTAADLRGLPRTFVFEQPVGVEWGRFSVTESFLRTSAWALDNIEFDWLAWISGQDYPIKSSTQIAEALSKSDFDAYIEAFDIHGETPWPAGEAISRYYFQYYRLPRFQYYYLLPDGMKQTLNKLKFKFNGLQNLVRIKGGYRKNPNYLGIRPFTPIFNKNFRCYGGSQWLTLRRVCVEYIQHYVKTHPHVLQYYKRTFIPDESFLLTILKNNKQLRCANHNLRFIKWDAKGGITSPQTLTCADLEVMMLSGAHFARKFDPTVDAIVLDKIDQIIAATQ